MRPSCRAGARCHSDSRVGATSGQYRDRERADEEGPGGGQSQEGVFGGRDHFPEEREKAVEVELEKTMDDTMALISQSFIRPGCPAGWGVIRWASPFWSI